MCRHHNTEHASPRLPPIMDGGDEAWVALQSAGAPLKDPGGRLLKQNEEGWRLDDAELDLAAYEQLLLTLPASPQYLSTIEIETLDYIRSKFGYTRRKHDAVAMSVALGAQRAEYLEQEAASEWEPRGFLLKAGDGTKVGKGGKKFKKRYFVLEGGTIEYFEKPGGKVKGSIDLTTASKCEPFPDPSRPNDFFIQCPDRTYELRCEDMDQLPNWVLAVTALITQNEVAMEGVLQKQGAKNKSFKARFFRILGTKLFYYDGSTAEGKPKGSIDLQAASRCRAMKSEADETAGVFPFSIVVEGRAWVLRATTEELMKQWVATICEAVPELAGMSGMLLKSADGKGKDRNRWFILRGKALYYYKDAASKSELGSIQMASAVGCRPASGTGDSFEIELAGKKKKKQGRVFTLQAESPELCRDWITSINQALHGARQAMAASSREIDDRDLPLSHLVEHRYQLIQEKRCGADFEGDVRNFLCWRKRQLVIWASAMDFQLAHVIGASPSSVGLGQGKAKIMGVVRGILDSTSWGAEEWTDDDEEDYEKRLAILHEVVEAVTDEAEKVDVEVEGDAAPLSCYPLHVATVFVERLMRRACFEEADLENGEAGGLDYDKDSVDIVLQHLGRRLKFAEGLYEILFSFIVLEVYRST